MVRPVRKDVMSDSRQDPSMKTLDRSPEEIEREIERTRDRMSTHLDQLTDHRLNPGTSSARPRKRRPRRPRTSSPNWWPQVRTAANRVRDYVARSPSAVMPSRSALCPCGASPPPAADPGCGRAIEVGDRCKDSVALVRDSVDEFLADDCPNEAAALSYYTIFALPRCSC